MILEKIRLNILNGINKSSERSSRAVKNIIASFIIKGLSILISLLLVPMTINYVSPTEYGIWLTLSSIIGWLSFFDIGFGNGLRNRFTEAKAIGDYEKAKAYISTTYICLGIIFSIVWLLFLFINKFLDWSIILNTPKKMSEELSIVALIIITFFCMQMVFKLINTVLIADQKPAKSSFLDLVGQLFSLFIIFILTKTTQGSLVYLALALGFCPILVMSISSLWFYKKEYKEFRPKISLFDRKIVKDIFRLGGNLFIMNIAGIVIYQTTNIIITQISSPLNVTAYNIAWKYFSIATMISSIIATPFWSASTDAYVKRDLKWMKSIHEKLTKLSFILVLLTLLLLICSSYAYSFWIGDAVCIPFSFSLVISLTTICSVLAIFQYSMLNGIGKLKVQLVTGVLAMFINIPLSIYLGKMIGVIGVLIPNLFFNLSLFILCYKQISLLLNNKAVGIWDK